MGLQNLRPLEIIAILLIIVLLFGAKKLPELAKGIGQSLKIFKKEVKPEVDDVKEAASAAVEDAVEVKTTSADTVS